MAKKSKKANSDNKNLIIAICSAVAVALVLAVIIVFAVKNNGLNDSFFVSDNTKYVLTIEGDEAEDGDVITPKKTHFVYTYEGDKITGMKSYFEYADADAAKAAFDKMKETGGEEAKDIELNGKYVIIPADEEVYKDLTASEVKQNIELMEKLKNMDTEDTEDTDATESTETTEENEE